MSEHRLRKKCSRCRRAHRSNGGHCRGCQVIARAVVASAELPPGQWVKRGLIWVRIPDEAPARTRPKVAQCGTTAGYQKHKRAGEQACELCLEALREADRQRRLKRSLRPLTPHGTNAAWMRHKLDKTKPCYECLEAHRKYQREWMRKARAQERKAA